MVTEGNAVKWPEREANYSPQPSAQDKNAWNYNFISTYVFMLWRLVKYWT